MRSISTFIRGLAIWFFALVLLTGCGGGGAGSPGSPGGAGTAPVVTPVPNNLLLIDITPSLSANLDKGLTLQFTATGYYSNGSVQNITSAVTWNSVSPAIATVDANGLATGMGVGTTNITASLAGITSSYVSLTVFPAVVKTIALTPANPNTAAGLSTQFTATGTYTDGTVKDLTAAVFWSSGNTAVATVNTSGLALAVSAGTATISATSGAVTGSATLTVANYTVSGTVNYLAAGSPVVLQNNGADNITVAADGTFVFTTPLASGTSYNVTVLTQPSAPAHPCNVQGGSGTITNTYITSIRVVCDSEVTTLAGNGASNVVDGPASTASFVDPIGIALDTTTGNLFVTDTLYHVIRKITPSGLVSTYAGVAMFGGATNGSALTATFNGPDGVAVDSLGNVYVADFYGSLIRKITPAGVVSTFAGSGTAALVNGTGTAASLSNPRGLAIDTKDNLYVADSTNHAIRKITPAGVVSTLAGSGVVGSANGTGTAASFNNPTGVAVDTAGNVYVADTVNQLIRKITPAGVVSTLAGTVGVVGSANGTGTAASFNVPTGVAVDTAGNVYVADYWSRLIRKITPAGVVSTLAGTVGQTQFKDGLAATAAMGTPQNVTVDAAGNLYVTDSWSHKVRKITP